MSVQKLLRKCCLNYFAKVDYDIIKQFTNSHNLHDLIDKVATYKRLEKYGILPKSYIINRSTGFNGLNVNMGQKMFFKIPSSDRGEGVFFDTLINLSKLLEKFPKRKKNREFLVQHEIKPDLIDGKKYSIRIYMLITNTNSMFIHKLGSVYLARDKYTNSTTSKMAQLSNYQIYADPKNYNMDNDRLIFDESFPNYDKYFEQTKKICTQIKDEFNEINLNGSALLGLDIMVDSEKKCWFIEGNLPDMDSSGPTYDTVNRKVGDDVIKMYKNLGPTDWVKL